MAASTVGELQTITAKAAADAVTAAGESEIKSCSEVVGVVMDRREGERKEGRKGAGRIRD
jgi:hypothetical protein